MPILSWPERPESSNDLPQPPLKKRKMTTHEHTEANSRLVFNKIIAGKYRNGDNGLDAVGVLLITWEDDDLYCSRSEVPRLHRIFEDQFGYEVENFRIPADRSATALAKKLADFAWRYDSPAKMAIVYYGGHGEFVEGRLKLFAKDAGNGDGDPTTFFDDAVAQLKLPDTDILVILDCCYAASAFSQTEIGKRKFELLTACPPGEVTYSPNHNQSFTKIVCDKLENLVKQYPEGFTTAKLYRHVYHEVRAVKRKPLLFDVSPYDWGKIQLRPFRRNLNRSTEGENGAAHSSSQWASNSIDGSRHYVDLSLRIDGKPTLLIMNQLATSMQYLPHVTELKFKHLRAPEDALRGFMRTLLQINALRPLVAKLRARLAERKRRELCKSAGHCQTDCEHCPQHLHSALHKKRKISALYDWGDSQLEEIEMEDTKKCSILTSLEPADTLMDSPEPAELTVTPKDPKT